MANLKEIRRRISSVKNIQQVTKAMNMVAAAKLRKAQENMFKLRPYANKLNELMDNVLSGLDEEDFSHSLLEKRETDEVLFVLITSNRGLAGPFNANIIKEAFTHIDENYADKLASGKVHFICIGKKGYDYCVKRKYSVIGENRDVFNNLSFETVDEIAEEVFELFLSGKVGKVYLAYNEFKNVMMQIRRVDTFLPLSLEAGATVEGAAPDYIYEPDKTSLLEELIPNSLKIQLYTGVLESNAAEQGARMVAMDTATQNADDLLKALKLSFNKARQAAITKEILEISAGADALSA